MSDDDVQEEKKADGGKVTIPEDIQEDDGDKVVVPEDVQEEKKANGGEVAFPEDVQEGKKVDGGKVAIPAFLQKSNTAPSPKPQWMKRLASNRVLNAEKNSVLPPKEVPGPSVESGKTTHTKNDSLSASLHSYRKQSTQPPSRSLSVTVHAPRPPPIKRSGPEYLVTGTVPRGRQLDEETRTAKLLERLNPRPTATTTAPEVKPQAGTEESLKISNEKEVSVVAPQTKSISPTNSPEQVKLKPVTPEKEVQKKAPDPPTLAPPQTPSDPPEPIPNVTEKTNPVIPAKTTTSILESSDTSTEGVYEEWEEESDVEEVLIETGDEKEVEDVREDATDEVGEAAVVETDTADVEASPNKRPTSESNWSPMETSSLVPGPPTPPEVPSPEPPKFELMTEKTNIVLLEEEESGAKDIGTSNEVEEPDSWFFPHHQEDDSSWVNPSRPVERERKDRLQEELSKRGINREMGNSDSTHQRGHLQAINEGEKYVDRGILQTEDNKVGIVIEPIRDGQTVSETSFSEMSSKRDASKVMEQSLPNRDLDMWAMPSQEVALSLSMRKLDPPQEGKDYRFSYIAAQHTHSTSTYADVIRERYFPHENNEYWAAPIKPEPRELAVHISRSGEIHDGPPDENESWLPPVREIHANDDGTSTEEKTSDGATNTKARRIDFAGAIQDESVRSEDSLTWNPVRQPSPPPSPTPQELNEGLPRPPSDVDLSETRSDTSFAEEIEGYDEEDDETEESGGDDEASEVGSSAQKTPGRASPIVFSGQHSSNATKGSSVQEPPKRISLDQKYDYSPSGRLKFDMSPKTIIIENDVERGNVSSSARKAAQSRKLSVFLCLFLFIIPATIVCIYFFVVEDRDSTSSTSKTPTPTLAPTSGFFTRSPGSSPTPSPTHSPTLRPSVGRTLSPELPDDSLLLLLAQHSSDGGASLQDSASAQYAAMNWIRESADLGNTDENFILQRYALAVLYYSTKGGEWGASTNWLSDETECDWYSSSSLTKVCNDDGFIVELNLNSNKLVGTIPPELGMLSNSLVSLQLSDNSLSGDIPSTIAALTKLQTLRMAINSFRGTLPAAIGTLSNLRSLYLYSNFFRSSIPPEYGELVRLRELDLGSNNLSGQIPTEFGSMSSLESLSLYDNQLTGQIPSTLGVLTSLTVLYLDGNSFSPTLPSSICDNLSIDQFWADCSEIGGCDCCTKCL
eukprot:Nitzschia sp. Nitz4//scaffold5_size260463//7271//11006//NITZ4_000935-RA/size260463-augustus-gene-0.24-mRNA-1//-1//CDS//3329555199//641//frame0